MNKDNKDRVVIVSGAGAGIGRAIAKAYAASGAVVVIAEKDREKGQSAEQEITDEQGQAVFFETDVSNVDQLIRLVGFVKNTYKKIDVLINNAGKSEWADPYQLTPEQWDTVMNTNLRSVFFLSREAAKVMREYGGGSIVNIASTRAIMSEPNSEAYAASKGGIIALTHSLAASFSDDAIQVNCISPGWIETGDYYALTSVDHDQHFSGRVGKPEDIARACLYLTSQENDFVTGTNLIIDGGMTRKMIYR